jgi:hypothetical protein
VLGFAVAAGLTLVRVVRWVRETRVFAAAAPAHQTDGARWARRGDLRALTVRAPQPGRVTIGRHRRVVGCNSVAVERREREHLVARRDVGNAGAGLLNHSGELIGRDRGQAVKLAAGDRRRIHAHERLSG